MIRINLLPPEFRVKERTPLPMLLGILGGVVLCVLILLVFVYCHIVLLPRAENELNDHKIELEAKKKKKKEYDDLIDKKKMYEGLDNMVKSIEQTKEHWAVYLRDLVHVFNDAEKENELLKAWMSDLSFSGPKQMVGRRAGPPEGGKIVFKCDIAGSDFILYSDFVEEVRREREGRVLPERILKINEPRLQIEEHRGYNPDKSVSFPFEITLQAKEQPKPKPKPKKKAPAQQK